MVKLTSPETYVRWCRYNKTNNEFTSWKNMQWVKYSIKETDMRIKTMTFTSPEYIDLTQGFVQLNIFCDAHETFRGRILSVEEDEDTGLWNYQCQDHNRTLNMKNYAYSTNDTVYNLIKQLLERKGMAKLLEPIEYYHQPDYNDIQNFNPMEKKINVIFDKIPTGNIIRSLIFDNNVFADFYFTTDSQPVIEPYNRDEWLGKGIYISTPELASYNMKFDITNIITSVFVKSSEALKTSKEYNSSDLLGVDLSCFYGYMSSTIDNPVKPTTSTGGGGGLVNVSKETPIIVNSDNINGKANDQKMINDCVAGLKSKGYTSVIGGSINPDAKYHDINKVADGGVIFWICGGICAGTFRDTAAKYYKNLLGNRKLVYGFLAPPIDDDLDQLSYLGNAHDDNFTTGSDGLKNPGDFLIDAGTPYVYGSNGGQLADNFANGGGGLAATVPGARIDTNPSNLKPQSEWRTNNSTTKDATTNEGSVTVDSNSANNVELEKQEALKVMTESVRDLLTFKMKIPGGNPVFKNLHTNSFLWTELPERMMLMNFKLTAEAMTGAYTRYAGYELNRWYIEGLTTNHDSSGLWFDIELNPFASAYSTYTNILKTAQEAYVRATTKTETGTTTGGSTGQPFTGNISTNVQEAANQMIGGATDPDAKAKLIFDWVDKNIEYEYFMTNDKGYTNSSILKNKRANCWTTAHLLYDLWSAVGVKCNIQNGYATLSDGTWPHTWNQVQFGGQMICADAGTQTTGRWGNNCNHKSNRSSTLKKNY